MLSLTRGTEEVDSALDRNPVTTWAKASEEKK